jgi:hypothetical protein
MNAAFQSDLTARSSSTHASESNAWISSTIAWLDRASAEVRRLVI